MRWAIAVRTKKGATFAGIVFAAGAVLAASVVLPAAWASDHLDGPRVTADPQADIADVFAFTSPENPGHLVLVMTVLPFASSMATFASGVDYVFQIRRVAAPQPLTLDATPLDVTCGVDTDLQRVTCSTMSGLSLTVRVDDPSGGGTSQSPMRVFAGRRADPAFFDRQGALATLASGSYAFTGQNAFAGANVLAMVVEVDPAVLVPPPDAGRDAATVGATEGGASGGTNPPMPILAISGQTVRRGT